MFKQGDYIRLTAYICRKNRADTAAFFNFAAGILKFGLAKSLAVAAPIPRPAPVTIAILSFNF
jgi:hypothetical protein